LRLEPDEGKLSRPVLRGGGLSNETSLPDEGAGQFCHRRLVAEWLEEHLGVVIPELPHHYNPDQLSLFD
jgi:hypothetical protein